MTRAADEPDAVYGLVAKSAEVADDGMSVTFNLRPEARFSDGSPLTADDVVFSFEALKEKGHPLYHQMLRDVVKAEALDPHTVRYSSKAISCATCRSPWRSCRSSPRRIIRRASSTRRRSTRRSAPAPM